MFRTLTTLIFLISFLVPSFSHAETALVFGVNEGSSGSGSFLERQEKYKGLADLLSKALKRPVLLESAADLKSLTKNLNSSRYGLLLVRPSHISAKAMRDQKYVLVASAKGDAVAYFIVPKDSPLKQLTDVKGKSIVTPDEIAYPTWIGLAMLRDLGISKDKANIKSMSSQEAVGYVVEKHLADVGVVISYSKVAKDWTKSGNRFLAESKKLPFWSVIGSPKLSVGDVVKVREILMKLDTTEDGKKILKDIGVSSFVAGDPKAYLDMLDWVGY
jgi:phosphonate transport system substrate-binding protein